MKDTARFDARAVRDVLLSRGGPNEDSFVRFAYRPFDDRWLYWEAETKLLREKSPHYPPHVFEGNLWLSSAQHLRRDASEPQTCVSEHIASLHLIERTALMFPVWLRDESIGSGGNDRDPRNPESRPPDHATGRIDADDDSPGRRPNLSASAQRYLEHLGLGVEDLFHHVLAVLHDPAYREANAGALAMEWPRIPLPGWPAPGNAGVSPAGVVGKAERVEAGEAPALPGSGPSASDLRSVAGRAFRPRTPALPGESSTHEAHEPTEGFAFPGNGASDEPDPNPGELRTTPSGYLGRREAAEALARSAARGRELARLLDSDRPVPGVTTGTLYPEVAVIAVPATTDGRNMAGGDFALTAGWGHFGAGGAVMPGQGRIVERAFTPEERAALGGTLPALGRTTFDVYLNARAFWRNVPAAVWRYRIGGYQVLKKWLSYRERAILDRTLNLEEVQHLVNTSRRIASILLLTNQHTHQ